MALALGAAYGLTWLAAGRPGFPVTSLVFLSGILLGAVAALRGTVTGRGERMERFSVIFGPVFVGVATARLVAAAARLLDGNGHIGSNWAAVAANLLIIGFLGGGSLSLIKAESPDRRLPDPLLVRIPPPAPRLNRPRKLKVRLRDGSVRDTYVVRGGYLGGRHRLEVDDIVDIVTAD